MKDMHNNNKNLLICCTTVFYLTEEKNIYVEVCDVESDVKGIHGSIPHE